MHVVQMQHAGMGTSDVTTSPNYASAVPQLVLCLGLLKGMAEVTADVPQVKMGLVGRLIMSRTKGETGTVGDERQQQTTHIRLNYLAEFIPHVRADAQCNSSLREQFGITLGVDM